MCFSFLRPFGTEIVKTTQETNAYAHTKRIKYIELPTTHWNRNVRNQFAFAIVHLLSLYDAKVKSNRWWKKWLQNGIWSIAIWNRMKNRMNIIWCNYHIQITGCGVNGIAHKKLCYRNQRIDEVNKKMMIKKSMNCIILIEKFHTPIISIWHTRKHIYSINHISKRIKLIEALRNKKWGAPFRSYKNRL